MYAVAADLLSRMEELELVQLTDEAGTGEIDQVKVDRALASASSTIDAYIAAAYRLPLATVHPMLVDIACDIARFKLYKSKPTEGVEKANTAALKALGQIRDGQIKIDSGVQELAERPGAIIVEGPEPEFTRKKMGGF